MSVGLGLARLVVIVFGLFLFAAGAAVIAVARGEAIVSGLWLMIVGSVFVVATLVERIRYRSDAVDREGEPPGPGGGEPLGTRLEPRFQRTDEIFTDPTSGHLMRVWMDPSSGERRYVAEG